MIEHDVVLIGGEWVVVRGERITVVSPSTEQPIGSVPDSSSATVDNAVAAARGSFRGGTWRRMTVDARIEVLERALVLLEDRLDEVGRIVTSEMGLPTRIAAMQIPGALSAARWFMEAARELPITEIRRGRSVAAVIREPVGVVASIAPWNGPFNMALSKVIPALVTGCSIVFKPAPETPLDAYVLAGALHDAAVPDGVFNLVTGGRDTGRALVAHPEVNKVSFTGSTAAGEEIGAECGRRFARVQLELGGKSAAIVLDDADVGAAVPALATGAFGNTGQVCASFSRILAARSRYDAVVDGLVAAAEALVVGDPFDQATTTGPLVSERQRDKVEGYIAVGAAEGAKLVTGGGRPEGLPRGWYVQPTVFAGADNAMRICQEEIFGPVTAVVPYDTVDEAIAIANDSRYGLHGGVFTQDPQRALDVAGRVETGTFSVNTFAYNKEAPFGGVKCSGIGRDTGVEAVSAYHELKTINITPEMEPLFAGAPGAS
ncbi:MAG: aldehyde dehydrogenase [Pseudonocardia sp. SCN 72-86]|nr:MAG: aldehyde dehydrogenase [Pseudonocardia sp. SCN 72-86]